MKTWIFAFCVCLCILVTACKAMPNQLYSRTRRARLCGNQLAEALAMVCESVYYTPRDKRSVSMPVAMKGDSMWRHPETGKFKSFLMHNTLGQKISDNQHGGLLAIAGKQEYFSRKTRQGVVDECCRKSCSFEELRAYCASSTYYEDEDDK